MSINRINYEQFALDYLEGNLSGDALKDMELFLVENADIKKELEELELFYLEEEEIIYSDKNALLQNIPVISITNKNKSFSLNKIIGIAAALLLFVMFSVIFLFNNDNLRQENNIVNIIDDKLKEIIKDNNSKNIIPLKKNSIPKIIEEENEIEFIAQEENTSKQEEKSIKEIQETKTVLENPIADSNPKKDIFNPVQNTSTDKIKNTIPEIEELIPNNIIANTKLPNITRINPISISIAKIELPKEKLPKINIISPYQDIENHSRKGVLAKLEDAGFIPERQPRGGKLRNAFIPESFSSRN